MPAINTYRTLNDYRLSPTDESIYENGSHSKLGAGALVAAIFLGVGAYFFYPMYQRGPHTTPAADTQYQAPAATETATPNNTMDSAALNSAATPDVPNATAPSPAIAPTDAATAPAQESKMNRTAIEPKSTAAPAQRTKPSTKATPTSTREAVPAATGDTTATPDMIKPAPIISPQPATTDHATDSISDPTVTHSDAPVEAPTTAAPDAATP